MCSRIAPAARLARKKRNADRKLPFVNRHQFIDKE